MTRRRTLAIVSACLVACVAGAAQNPTIFEDGWSPVHSSQVVQLPDPGARVSLPQNLPQRQPVVPDEDQRTDEVADRRVDEEVEEETEDESKDDQIDRIDVVQERVSAVSGPVKNENYVDHPSQVTKVYLEDGEDEEPEGETAAPPNVNKNPIAEDDTPVIIYPSGTVPSNYASSNEGNRFGSNEDGQVEEHLQQNPYPNEDGVPPHLRVPRPPHLNRYQPPPVRGQPQQRRPLPPPPPPNWRRPPPPLQGPAAGPELAYQRNVPEEDGPLVEAAASRQNPYDGPPRPPRPESSGGVFSTIGTSLSNLGANIKCSTEDIAVDARLQDEAFMQRQLNCVLDKGPCDELGANVKRLAPDIMRGICPHPCNECQKGKIQKVMSTIARKYPKQWNQMVREFGIRAQQRQRTGPLF